jgi:hypothetical protein
MLAEVRWPRFVLRHFNFLRRLLGRGFASLFVGSSAIINDFYVMQKVFGGILLGIAMLQICFATPFVDVDEDDIPYYEEAAIRASTEPIISSTDPEALPPPAPSDPYTQQVY